MARPSVRECLEKRIMMIGTDSSSTYLSFCIGLNVRVLRLRLKDDRDFENYFI